MGPEGKWTELDHHPAWTPWNTHRARLVTNKTFGGRVGGKLDGLQEPEAHVLTCAELCASLLNSRSHIKSAWGTSSVFVLFGFFLLTEYMHYDVPGMLWYWRLHHIVLQPNFLTCRNWNSTRYKQRAQMLLKSQTWQAIMYRFDRVSQFKRGRTSLPSLQCFCHCLHIISTNNALRRASNHVWERGKWCRSSPVFPILLLWKQIGGPFSIDLCFIETKLHPIKTSSIKCLIEPSEIGELRQDRYGAEICRSEGQYTQRSCPPLNAA